MLYPGRFLLLILLVPVSFSLWHHYLVSRRMLRALLGSWKNETVLPLFKVKFILYSISLLLALFFLIVSLSGLIKEDAKENLPGKGLDLIIALDISRSMLADDAAPSRLQQARSLAQAVLGSSGNIRAGLVVFKGKAAIAVPLTEDLLSVSSYLDMVTPSFLSSTGSDISEAVRVSLKSFDYSEDKKRVVFLLSDGEIVGSPSAGTIKNALSDVTFLIAGAGSQEGSTIRTADGELVKDRNNDIVVSRLNENSFKVFLEDTNGLYVRSDNVLALTEIQQKLASLGNSSSGKGSNDYNPRYRPFLLLSFLFIITAGFVKGFIWKKTF